MVHRTRWLDPSAGQVLLGLDCFAGKPGAFSVPIESERGSRYLF
jgi:hypothetical protein